MEIQEVTCFTIAAENKPGTLAAFVSKMKQQNVDLAGLWGWGEGAKAGIIAIPKNGEQFQRAAKTAGYAATEGRCYRLTGEDRVGALTDTLDRVGKEQINLQAVDAVSHDGRYTAYIWPQPADAERMKKLLKV
ncbi:MAG: hypothetical protein AB1515_06930 [Nitrospirota bacterium]